MISHPAPHHAGWHDELRVGEGHAIDLAGVATRDPRAKQIEKADRQALLAADVERLSALQEKLYADRQWSVLVILQALDAGGKDGTIKHVFSGINPQGLSVVSFKAPNGEDLSHDFLWRVHRVAPARGVIGVFNRSHYEEVVVTRVHPKLLAPQRLPESVSGGPDFWADRLADIRSFESYLTRQGTRIVKIFLHIGPDEQKARLRARLDDPTKLWKFDPGDLREREYWPDYMKTYAQAIAATSTAEAPWFIVPADQKWFARLMVARIVVATLEDLDLRDREPDPEVLKQLAQARRALA